MARLVNSIVVLGLIAIQLAVPWIFAGVRKSTQSWMSWALAGLALGALLWMYVSAPSQRDSADRSLRLVWIVAIGIFVGWSQLIPLPSSVVPYLAPGAAAWRSQQLGGVPAKTTGETESSQEDTITRSIYPPDTRTGLALLVIGLGVLWLTIAVADKRHLQWIMITTTTSGVAIAIFGIVQKFRWNGKLFWVYELSQGGSPFGPFINRNSGGGYLCLCLAAALGLLVQASRPASEDRVHSFDTDRTFMYRTASIASVVFICLGILACGSRGASLALVVGLLVTLVCWFRTAIHRADDGDRGSWLIGVSTVVIALGATALLLGWLDAGELTSQRWQQTFEENQIEDGRVPNWSEALHASTDFAGFGSGLMTYRFVSLPEQQRVNLNWYRYAENIFVQTFVELGVVGIVLLLAAIFGLASAIGRLLKSRSGFARSVGIMGSFLLASQVVAVTFDIGFWVPANMIVMATLAGVVVASRCLRTAQNDRPNTTGDIEEQPEQPWAPPVSFELAGWILLIPLVYGGYELSLASQIESLAPASELNQMGDWRSPIQVDERIAQLSAAVARRADDAEAHAALAELYLQRSQIELFEAYQQQQPWLNEDRNWERASLLDRVNRLGDFNDKERAKFRRIALADPYLNRAVHHFERARSECPWLARPHLMIGFLRYARGSHSKRELSQLAQSAVRFGGGRPDVWFLAGLISQLDGNQQQAIATWRRCLSATNQFDEVIAGYLTDSPVEMLFESLLRGNIQACGRWVQLLKAAGKEREANQLVEWTLQAVENESEMSAAEHANAARFLAQIGRLGDAIDHWTKSIVIGGNPRFRFEFAQTLVKAGRAEEALNQLEQCHHAVGAAEIERLKAAIANQLAAKRKNQK